MNKNQKWRRVLSLLFAMVMLVSIMVVGSVVAFADQVEDDSENAVAVLIDGSGNTKYYDTLASAVANSTNGDNYITMLKDCNETFTITQKENVNITIDGKNGKTNHQFGGKITIKGSNRSTGSETLEFKNITIVKAPLEGVDGSNWYNIYSSATQAHNITFTDCNFYNTWNYYQIMVANVYNVKFDGGIVDSTGNLWQSNSNVYNIVVDGLTVKNVNILFKIDRTPNNTTTDFLKFTGVTVEKAAYVLALSNYNISKPIEFIDCEIYATTPVYLWDRNTTTAYSFKVNGNNTIVSTSGGNWLSASNAPVNEIYVNVAAQVGGTYYESLDEAIADLELGDVLEDPANVGIDYDYVNDKLAELGKNFEISEDGTVSVKGVAVVTDANGNVVGYYPTLQAAIDACVEGENVIHLVATSNETVTIKQTENVNITIDGNNNIFSGTIKIDGNERPSGTETLTIQYVKFVNTTATTYARFIDAEKNGNDRNSEAHNVTIKNCYFESNNWHYTVFAKHPQNWRIEDCTANKVYYFFYNPQGGDTLYFNRCEVTSATYGIGTQKATNVYVGNYTYVGMVAGFYGRASSNLSVVTLENVNITTTLSGQPAITLWKNDDNTNSVLYTFNFKGTNVLATNGAPTFAAQSTTNSPYVFQLVDVNATVKCAEDLTGITTNLGEQYKAVYKNGKYSVDLNYETGTWGGIDWTLYPDGTLVIAPTAGTPVADPNCGKTYEVGVWREAVKYDSKGEALDYYWPYDRTKVKKLIIEEGVIAIGSFNGWLPNLTGELVIPSTVKYIGQDAFNGTPISVLTFTPGGTEELCIAQGAFKGLLIEEVTLPTDRPVHLHAWVFGNCLKLKHATLPATVNRVWGSNHIDYFKNFEAESNATWGNASLIFTGCSALETVTFGSEAVRDMFYKGGRNGINSWKDGKYNGDYIEATIGLISYNTLANAINAAQTGDTIVLVKDITLSEAIVITKDVTIDLNGKTVNGNGVYPAFRIVNNAEVTIQNGTVKNTDYVFVLGASDGSSAGYLTIESGTYIGTTTVASVTKGTLTINGGNFSVNDSEYGATYLLNCVDANYNNGTAKIVVIGGTFTGFNPVNNTAEGTNTNFCAEGYCANENNGVYTVATHIPGAAATCTTAQTCTVCDAVLVPATGHSYTTTTVAPTFDAQGYDLHTCSVCGHSYKDNYVAQLVLVATLYDVDNTTVLGNFETLMDALRSVTDDKQHVVVYQDVTEYIDYNRGEWLRGNIRPAGDEVTITLTNTDYVYCMYTFAIYEGVTLKMNKMFYYAGDAAIYGDLIVQQYYQSHAYTHLHIVAPGSFTVTSHEGFTITNTGDPNAGIYVWGDKDPNTVELSIPVVYAYEGMIFGEDATIEALVLYSVDNLRLHNSTLNVKGATDYNISIYTNHNTNIELYHNSHIKAVGSVMTYGSAIVDKTSSIKGVYGDYEAQNSTSENIIPATCTTPGSYVKVVYCGHCGAEIYRENMVIPATGHTAGEEVKENVTDPTYSKEGGYDLVVYCTICGEKLSSTHVTIPVLTSAAEVGGVKYGTLKDAIALAKAGETITLLKDLTEDVTINKNNLTIDGNGKQFTGKMLVGAANITVTNVKFVNGTISRVDGNNTVNYTITNCSFEGVAAGYGYAIIVGGKNTSVVIDNCTANKANLLHVASSCTTITVTDVTVTNCDGWAFHLVPSATYYFENVKIDGSDCGIVVQNTTEERTVTLKNCVIDTPKPLFIWAKEDKMVNFKLLGTNDFGTNDPVWETIKVGGSYDYATESGSVCSNLILGEVGATLKAGACKTVSEFSLDYYVVYKDGVYSLAKALKFASSNLLLTDTIGIYFNVDKNTLDSTKTYYVEITDAKGEIVDRIFQKDWAYGYKALYNGLAAKQMADEFTATIVCVEDESIVCRSVTESVKGYAQRGWDKFKNDANTIKLLTAMLNYGAEAQIAFEYNVNNLANSFLTVQKDENVADDTTVEDTTGETTEETNKAPVNEFYYYGASLNLESNIIFNFKFFADKMTAISAKVTYVDANGKEVVLDTAASDFKGGVTIITETNNSGTELIVVKVDKLLIQDAAAVFTCELTLKDKDKDGKDVVVVRTATDSVIYYSERAINGLNAYQVQNPDAYKAMTFKQKFYRTLMEYVEIVSKYEANYMASLEENNA